LETQDRGKEERQRQQKTKTRKNERSRRSYLGNGKRGRGRGGTWRSDAGIDIEQNKVNRGSENNAKEEEEDRLI
jgi:hypothetical protein